MDLMPAARTAASLYYRATISDDVDSDVMWGEMSRELRATWVAVAVAAADMSPEMVELRKEVKVLRNRLRQAQYLPPVDAQATTWAYRAGMLRAAVERVADSDPEEAVKQMVATTLEWVNGWVDNS